MVEERRIQRQQEIEKKRLEDELKRQREKEVSRQNILFKAIIKSDKIVLMSVCFQTVV